MKSSILLLSSVLAIGSCAHGADDFSNLIGAAGQSSAGTLVLSEAGLEMAGSDVDDGSGGSSNMGTGGATAGGGGTLAGSAAGQAGGGLRKCDGAAAPSGNNIATFEDGNAAGLYVYDDTSGGGAITPATNSTVKTGLKDGGANGTSKAFEFGGTGFGATSYGGGVGISLLCTNASALHGIRLWIKSNVKVAVALSTSDDTVAPNGDCIGNANTCVSPTAFVDSTSGVWSDVTLPWSNFAGGTPRAFDPAEIVGVGLVIQRPLGASNGWGWDVWFDELQFY